MRRARGVPAIAALAACVAMLATSPANAGPTLWSRARDPRVSIQDELVRDAQKAFLRYRRMARASGAASPSLAKLVLRDARLSLGKVVAAGGTDFGVQLLYVKVLRSSNENDEALAVLKRMLKQNPPAPQKADALTELAILHAMGERREEEIRAYTEALALEPHGDARAQLLSNRAEALMATGDVTSAVEGYRAALARLTSIEMFWYGSTTFFGLGVALDRSGNPEAGLESVKIARSYDRTDRGLRSGDWFFSPAHDAHWYWALGGWSCARFSEGWGARSECYEQAIAEWQLYIDVAPENDRWVPLARVRLAQVKREQERMKRDFEAQRKKPVAPGGTTK